MKTKIYFIENSSSFNFSDLNSPHIAGSEKTLINITNELSKDKNLIIKVFNKSNKTSYLNNVSWNSIHKIDTADTPDYLIAMSDANLLSKIKCKKKFLWSHSVQPIEKFIRKKQLFSYLKYRPKIILLSNYHSKNRNIFLKIFGSKQLEWAVDDIFLNTSIDNDLVENRAIFTSREDRNLNILIDIWKNKIFSQNKISKLYVTPSVLIDNKYNIYCRNFSTRNFLIKDLIKSKVYLVPGHKSELFCIAAEEARELCIPIVTLGIGCLSERVIHGQTGFVAKNDDEFAKYTLDILNDNSIWSELRNNLIKLRGSRKWLNVASNLIKDYH